MVNRKEFMNYINGIFLKDGIACDETLCKKVQEEMDNGKIIGLTVKGQLVSFMKFNGKEYKEFLEKQGFDF
jgi:hypothetical protein